MARLRISPTAQRPQTTSAQEVHAQTTSAQEVHAQTTPAQEVHAQTTPAQEVEDDYIRVCVRKRPLSDNNEEDIITINSPNSLKIDKLRTRADLTYYIERHTLIYDDVFDADANDKEVYNRTALPLIKYIFRGGKAMCFAYGPTGSGKTYTMFDQSNGLCVFAARDIFTLLEDEKYSHLGVYVGFYEIYKKKLHNLLDNRKIMGLQVRKVVDVETLLGFFDLGNTIRSTGSTGAILQIVLKHKNKFHGKISFVDLAGSDRDLADVEKRMEGAEINKSLLTLSECIRAFDQDKKHIPFRDSKLTQVLKDSFVRNSRTCIVATVTPDKSNFKQTMNALRYVDDLFC